MKKLFTLTGILFCAAALSAQCPAPQRTAYLHGNEIRASVTTGGDLFWDGDDYASFRIYNAPGRPATIYAQALWLVGRDPAGNMRGAGQDVRSIPLTRSDYSTGPFDVGQTSDPAYCERWDRVWSVARHEIEAHLADYADNQQIDAPIATIMDWPGRGNPYFEARLGFSLPDAPYGLAPFFDADGDGVYDPLAGDYPIVESMAQIPEQITWVVFNDFHRPLPATSFPPLGVEVHRTSWVMRCEGNSPLNRTVFVGYKIINRGIEFIDSVRMGLKYNFQLGCDHDDYLGSSPAHNAFFVYNRFPVDQLCSSSFGANPPVQAVTVLNRPLNSFMVLLQGTGTLFSPGAIYNATHGFHPNGVPITAAGTGYNTAGDITRFAFPGDPNDLTQWSMHAVGGIGLNFPPNQCVGGISLGRLEPGEWTTVETAYLYVREPGLNHLENVTAMYQQLEALQADYQNGFADECLPPIICSDDCVWPGDANADGIANHEDMLAIGLGLSQSGPTREGILNWSPWFAENWSTAGRKHADTDGNGAINTGDAVITRQHYGFTRPDYVAPPDTYPQGPELTITPFQANINFSNITAGKVIFTRISLINVPELKGLSFSLEYDSRYFEGILGISNFAGSTNLRLIYRDPIAHQLDFAWYRHEAGALIGAQNSLHLFNIKARDNFSEPVPSDTTYIRFKNIIGIREDGSLIPVGGTDLLATFLGVTVADEEQAPLSAVRLFPNPTDGLLHLQFPEQRLDRIALLTTTGQVLRVAEGPFFDTHQLHLEGLPAGMYFVRLEQAEQTTVRKVVLR
ncbi:MAG: T9SS type A sorting domain-containing protein [Saprospiraceae bacterium]|nr:T9SS type A sorting domain-containing protein [Saprospiraceae bacterium]